MDLENRRLFPVSRYFRRFESRGFHRRRSPWALALAGLLVAGSAAPQPESIFDLATVAEGDQRVFRLHGSDGNGQFGVPVAGGFDMDGDGLPESAVAFMTAEHAGVPRAGEVVLSFGTGLLDGARDSANAGASILTFAGGVALETAGSEIWMDDVTGDGLGDLLICRQNYTIGSRCGAGALTIIAGGASLRTAAAGPQPILLDSPPATVTATTILGRNSGDRFCIWARTGDIDGDGTADIAVGADQEDMPNESNRGAVYVVRGGAHLGDGSTYDLGPWGNGNPHPLDGLLARIEPPTGSDGFHLGGTCQVADLDGNGRAEVLMAATINRAGAGLPPTTGGGCIGPVVTQGSGGSPRGTLYIAWDDNFPMAPWVDGYTFEISASPGSRTVIDGEAANESFGEEILGGSDLDGDGAVDLFVGDLVADGTVDQSRPISGLGHVLFNAASLKDQVFTMDAPPAGLAVTRILGAENGDIAADTAAEGDFDGDGLTDIAIASPHADPGGRDSAGAVHVLFGQRVAWPALLDLAAIPPPSTLRIAEVWGALGTDEDIFGDTGDTLGYSAAAGDLDGDGRTDLIINEMEGNGLQPGTLDVGNLLLISGRSFDPALLFDDGFESGDTGRWAVSFP
ncbi:MAG: FG-GAP repeat protein [Acidobacteriota bacterium]